MGYGKKYGRIVCALWLLLSALTAGTAHAASLQMKPSSMKIGLFFSGCRVDFTGAVLSNRDVVIEVIGPEGNSRFNIKEKVGLFWMNRQKAEIQHAPLFYSMLLPTENGLEKEIPALNLGIDNLKKKISVRSDNSDPAGIVDMFVRLKRSENLYQGPLNVITYSHSANGEKAFTAQLDLPSSVAPGQYRAIASVVYQGAVEDKVIRDFEVLETGIVGLIHGVAYQTPLFYGILSVLIALLVGAMMGVVFKGGKSH